MKFLITAAVFAVIASPAAAHGCWIDKVYAVDSRLEVHFSHDGGRLLVARGDETPASGRYNITGTTLQVLDANFSPTGDNVGFVVVQAGDRGHVAQFPSFICGFSVESHDGKLGIQLDGFDVAPGNVRESEGFILPDQR